MDEHDLERDSSTPAMDADDNVSEEEMSQKEYEEILGISDETIDDYLDDEAEVQEAPSVFEKLFGTSREHKEAKQKQKKEKIDGDDNYPYDEAVQSDGLSFVHKSESCHAQSDLQDQSGLVDVTQFTDTVRWSGPKPKTPAAEPKHAAMHGKPDIQADLSSDIAAYHAGERFPRPVQEAERIVGYDLAKHNMVINSTPIDSFDETDYMAEIHEKVVKPMLDAGKQGTNEKQEVHAAHTTESMGKENTDGQGVQSDEDATAEKNNGLAKNNIPPNWYNLDQCERFLAQSAYEIGNSAGDSAIKATVHGDENFSAGAKDLKTTVAPVLELAAAVGVHGIAVGLRDEMNNTFLGAAAVRELITNGKMTPQDLGDKQLLKSKLVELQVPRRMQHSILKNLEFVKDTVLMRDVFLEIQERKAKTNMTDQVSKRLRYLKTREAFDMAHSQNISMLGDYFKENSNEYLQNVNRISISKIKKMLKAPADYRLTQTDQSALRILLKQKMFKEVKIKANQVMNLRKIVIRIGRMTGEKTDDLSQAGIKDLQKGILISYGTVRTGLLAVSVGCKTSSFLVKNFEKHTKLGRLQKELRMHAAATAKKMAVQAAVATKNTAGRTVQKVVVSAAGRTAKKGMDALKGATYTPAAITIREKIQRAGKMAKAAGWKSMQAKAAMGRGIRTAQSVGSVVFSPLNLVTRSIGNVYTLYRIVRRYILIAVGIAVVSYALLTCITGVLLATMQEQEDAMSTVILEDSGFVAFESAYLETLAEQKKSQAGQLANGAPQNPSVKAGHEISRYGHPGADGQWVSGSKITYLDADGNEILDGHTNTKDVIVLAYVLMGGDFMTNTKARDALVRDLWDIMNPEVTCRESEIYSCPVGCAAYQYQCNDTAAYQKIQDLQNQSVMFYQSIVPQKAADGGCMYTMEQAIVVTDYTMKSVAALRRACTEKGISYTVQETKEELVTMLEEYDAENPQTELQPKYGCTGHTANICYGHKDIEVYITTLTMWDVMDTGMIPAGSSYQPFLGQFEGWTDWNREWAQSLYDANWSDLYGVSLGGSDFSVGSGLTDSEIAAITEQYGNLDAARTVICADAMSFAGKIPYYWGGKSSNPDYTANHFGSVVTADYKGRTKKGLDCSGFVNWILLRNLGHAYGSSTRDTTTGLKQISRSQLQPGDLGLENPPGSAANHIGFFVGYNSSGQALWCHCSGGAGNVTVNTTTCFRLYYSLM